MGETPVPAATAEAIRKRLESLAKPVGSLGRLERLAARLAETQSTLAPVSRPRHMLLFAGDHGVVEAGVGIWPSEVTAAMIALIGSGRASSSALARASGTTLGLIDVGSRVLPAPEHAAGHIGQGTRNLAREPAMTPEEFHAAWDVGAATVRRVAAAGCRVLGLGEMGIGNTTSAACLTALVTGCSAEQATGPGAGATAATLDRKRRVVADAVARARALWPLDQVAALASVSGFEIAAMAGAIARARQLGLTVILDGYVTGAAALTAFVLDPCSMGTAIAAHRSAEPGHALALAHLGLEPYLEWDLRLGEGTGALLLMPLLDAAAALLTEVATLAEVTGR
ncbi:MAG: nicotinate-nucleotide--dimethylbenzimidazole phosphoribosyltransferase [Hyphomicrobium sp.]|nr:nicotinate-nucleotide--dimethylbenzimidazole phosphoribosyltransferase [Hyphomicrobium sp.]PPC83547.1 MAG: nicotinate-nucleotide--dimethylbenzimidazole phosphoribosyltransferase [Hyphomicrobium sp.]